MFGIDFAKLVSGSFLSNFRKRCPTKMRTLPSMIAGLGQPLTKSVVQSVPLEKATAAYCKLGEARLGYQAAMIDKTIKISNER